MYIKYRIEKQQKSYDNGVTWYDVGVTRNGASAGTYSTLSECESGSTPDSGDTNPYASQYLTIESLEDNNVIYLKATSSAAAKTISASTDNGQTWTEYISSSGGNGTTIATLNTGGRVLLKGENDVYEAYTSGGRYYNLFKSTGQFELKGNIMSLISGDSFTNATSISSYGFYNMFSGCTGLTLAENLVLPATTLEYGCYSNMFQGCTSLTVAPELPATTLASYCYYHMFDGCTSLTTAPVLPATTLGNSCYRYMFQGCTSLTTAPELPATTLVDYCYEDMFRGCTSLTTAPELPATTLAEYCYGFMFQDCTNLATAPELPVTTLASSCYSNMFNGCTSLVTAPELPATTLANGCYSGMFRNCTSLNYIKAMFTTTPSGTYTNYWVSNVASTGTFVKNSTATWDVSGVSGIPTGWTVVNA